MAAVATVLYPNDADAKFDLDYYLKTHMPLVDKHWQPVGLKGWSVTQFVATDGQQPKYSVGAVLSWESHTALDAALKGEGAKEIFGDIPNFSNKEPVLMAGNILARGGALTGLSSK